MIAVSGLDMAAWDALARAADLPLAVFLGGSLAPVPACNSNGLWLTPVDELGEEAAALVAEGGFRNLKHCASGGSAWLTTLPLSERCATPLAKTSS